GSDGGDEPLAEPERTEESVDVPARGGGGHRTGNGRRGELVEERRDAADGGQPVAREAQVVVALPVGEPPRPGPRDFPPEEAPHRLVSGAADREPPVIGSRGGDAELVQ